jgi:hypothetical protein
MASLQGDKPGSTHDVLFLIPSSELLTECNLNKTEILTP